MKIFYSLWICSTLLICSITPAMQAQDDPEAVAERERAEQEKQDQKERWESILASIRDDARNSVIRHLEVVISEIERSSSLDEPQLMKLKLGAKGSADKAVEEWAANLEKQQGLIQQLEAMAANQIRVREAQEKALEKANAQKKDAADPDKKEDGKEMKVDFDKLITQWGRQIQPATAENQTLWTTTLDKTLTKDQKSAWDKSKQQRAEFERSLQVAQAVQAADSILRFTNDQRQQFFELLSKPQSAKDAPKGGQNNAGNKVVIQANGGLVVQGDVIINGLPVEGGMINFGTTRTNGRVDMSKLKREQLSKFLSKEQMALWDDIIKDPKQIRNNHLFFGNQGVQGIRRGAVNIQAIIRR